jgi:hypothetical protein
MVPLPLLPLFVSQEDNVHSTNANSSPTTSAHAICRALKVHTSLDRPLLASCKGGKDGKGDSSDNNGNTGGNGQELDYAPN